MAIERAASNRVLVTGANGFVGRRAVQVLSQGWTVRAAVRQASISVPAPTERAVVGALEANTSWTEALTGVDAVLHLAARVHVMQDRSADPLTEFRRVNVDGTLNLARQAAAAGVRRFVFVSSIKVSGEQSAPGRPIQVGDVPAPLDPYGVSKFEAEQQLRELASHSGMEVCIIRPVLVYGPGVKGNFLAMLKLLERGVPLPFGRIDNRRSLVALDNLVDLARLCLVHPAASNETFLASDDHDLSTTQLLRMLGDALGKPARLLPVPARLLDTLAALLGQRALAQRLLGTLQVDITRTRQLLGWNPATSVEAALQSTARAYLEGSQRGNPA